jgi:hypothetical protein
MTHQEAELEFRQKIIAAIENARANGLNDATIAHDLSSIAHDVSKQWDVEVARRNAERIAQIRGGSPEASQV